MNGFHFSPCAKGRGHAGRLLALFGAGVACALLWCGCATFGGGDDKPRLRVGILSDTQSHPGKATDRGQLAMRKAMEQLKGMGVDVLIVAGDISDNGNRKVYEEYREIVDEVFGDEKPEQFAIMGNHDYWNGKSAAEARRNFCEGMKVGSACKHKVVGGYDFIAVSPDNGDCTAHAYGKEASAYMREEVAAAVARDPGRPVFVVTHQHAYGTVYGSFGWGNKAVAEILAPYGDVLLFSGHSHFALEDERSIDQDRFTAIGTSSLAYCELEGGRVNGSVPPHAGECRQYLYMEVYGDRLVVKRFDMESGAEIKAGSRWVIPLPLERENFVYTRRRAEGRAAPAFPAGAEADVSFSGKKPSEPFVLSFPAARHDDFVHTYLVKAYAKEKDGGWRKMREYKFFSDFYRGLGRMADPYSVRMPSKGFVPGSEYKLEVYPVESFGKTGGEPASVVFRMPGE